MDLTYTSYLQLDRLLTLQQPRSAPPEHDEMIFIVTHQVYELWFKLQLHELEKIRDDFCQGRLWEAIATWKRCRTIMKVMVEQIDILETMTPTSFRSFRDRLETASGFQSYQFREFEFLLGFKRQELLRYHPPGSPGHDVLQRRLAERSVYDCFLDLLAQRGAALPPEVKERDAALPAIAHAAVAEGILRLYHAHPDLEILFELMTDFDEGFQEWRYRHIKLVERTIGNKHGTGGSLGVEFLKQTLFHPVFPDLWTIRHQL